MKINVRIVTNAKKSEIVGWEGKTLKIRIAAAPIEGKANKELIRFLADVCDCAQSEIEIARGMSSKDKTLNIPDLDLHDLRSDYP